LSCKEDPEAHSAYWSRKNQTYQRNGVSFALGLDVLFFSCLTKISMTNSFTSS
jgi:hypothetical protein